MITIVCSCGRQFKTQDGHSGKKTKCPVCGNALVAPAPDVEAGQLGKAERPTPPSWWYPKGGDHAPEGSALPAPAAKSARDRAANDPLAADRPTAGSPLLARKKNVRLISAVSVAGIAILSLGVMIWTQRPAPDPERVPVDKPIAISPIPVDVTANAAAEPETSKARPRAIPSREDGAISGAQDRPPSATSPASPEAGRPRLSLLIPAYYYPAGPGLKEWEKLIAAADKVPIVAIANPATGPGDEDNADYAAVIGRASRGGVTVVGYVSTGYGKRPAAEVRSEVDRWVRFYPEIRGIFFDAQASEPGHAAYYAELRDYACMKIGGATVINNPGTTCSEEYGSRLTSVDLCLFESPAGFEKYRLPRWADRRRSGRFAAMPYQVPDADRMRDCIQVASSRGFGLICVTDAKLPNPWDRLPSYWDDEVEAVRKANLGQTP